MLYIDTKISKGDSHSPVGEFIDRLQYVGVCSEMDINYERREGRLEQAIEVDPDAHDTYIELTSSIAMVG